MRCRFANNSRAAVVMDDSSAHFCTIGSLQRYVGRYQPSTSVFAANFHRHVGFPGLVLPALSTFIDL